MTEKQLREKIVNLFEHYVRRDDNDEPIWYIDNGDSFYGTIYEAMSLFTNQLNIKDAEHAKALELAKIEAKLSECQSWKCKNSDNTSSIEARISQLTKQKDLLTKENK